MTDSGIDARSLDTRLDAIQSALGSALDARVAALGIELKARIEAKLSGDLLATKSGALLASLSLDQDGDADSVTMRVVSSGVPYARIQEFGGRTAAHDILAVKAKALDFVTDGKTMFAARVHHPGSVIPPHFFMHGALDDMHDEIVAALKSVVGDAIRTA